MDSRKHKEVFRLIINLSNFCNFRESDVGHGGKGDGSPDLHLCILHWGGVVRVGLLESSPSIVFNLYSLLLLVIKHQVIYNHVFQLLEHFYSQLILTSSWAVACCHAAVLFLYRWWLVVMVMEEVVQGAWAALGVVLFGSRCTVVVLFGQPSIIVVPLDK